MKVATFKLELNDQNEIETFELLNLFTDMSEVSSSPDDESDDGSEDGSDDGGYWMPEEPEGGIWYNGDDYVGGVYVGPRDW